MPETGHLAHYKILIAFFCMSLTVFPQTYPDPNVHKLISKGLYQTFNQQYNDAMETFRTLDRKYPELPFGKVFLGGTYVQKALDLGNPLDVPTVRYLYSEAIKIANKRYNSDNRGIWDIYAKGLVEGYNAYFLFLQGQWLSGISNGLKALGYFEDCLERDSSFYDSYLALGVYKYWRSEKMDFLSWVPFFPNEQEEGIRNLQYALKNNSYHSYYAADNLFWIYLKRKELTKAKTIVDMMLEKNPESRHFLWILARYYEEVDRKKAIDILFKIRNSYKKESMRNRVKDTIIIYILAKHYVALNMFNEARSILAELPDFNNLTDYEKSQLEERYQKIEVLKSTLNGGKK